MKYTLTVEQDPETNEYVLVFPDEVVNDLGWEIGDTLIWETIDMFDENGRVETISLRKAE